MQTADINIDLCILYVVDSSVHQGNRVGPQLSRTSLGNVVLKKKRFSAGGQNIAQNCTMMRIVPDID